MSNSKTFSYVKYDQAAVVTQETFKKMFEAIEEYAKLTLKDSRPKSLLMTALEEAYMWTGKAIRDDQIERDSQTEHKPERG